MNIPTPAILNRSTPARVPSADEKRGCLSKVRYATEALALDTAAARMLSNADRPLQAYPCSYCTGFHLTSKGAGPRPSIEVPAYIEGTDPSQVVRQRDRHGRSAKHFDRYVAKRHYAGVAKARRERQAENRIDRLPRPHVASEPEQALFFARIAAAVTETATPRDSSACATAA